MNKLCIFPNFPFIVVSPYVSHMVLSISFLCTQNSEKKNNSCLGSQYVSASIAITRMPFIFNQMFIRF